MIEIESLTKRFGDFAAVEDLTFTAPDGAITGFLGPNGAGKSTTMRMIVGLDAPTAGSARVGGHRYQEMRAPLTEVGALLDARAVHPGRPARAHLTALARTHGISRARVEEVISLVGLAEVAGRRAGTFSLGMSQRLGVASALLGDPGTLILDEPVNGLDAEGILWIRTLLKRLAAEGRTILLSSHLMSEMAQTADHLVIVGRGRLLADTTVQAMVAEASEGGAVTVRAPRAGELADVLAQRDGARVRREPDDDTALRVDGLDSAEIGEAAAAHGIALHALVPTQVTLEDAYLRMTRDSVDYRAEEATAA